MKKILVTGVNGQVGHELLRSLAPLGEVIGVSRAQLDLTDVNAIKALLDQVEPHIIVNPAAYTAVDKAESEPDLAYAINTHAPATLAEWAAKRGASLIHYSTDYVFDGTATRPYTEDAATNPLNVYGASKLAGEQAITATGADAIILRTTWVYGSRGNNFLRTILRLAKERSELKIVADQIGAPTWSRMLAEATALIIARQLGKQALTEQSLLFENSAGIYHLSAAGKTSWHGFAQAIVQQAQQAGEATLLNSDAIFSIPSSDYPTPAQRPAYSLLDNSKIAQVFGVHLPAWGKSLCVVMGS